MIKQIATGTLLLTLSFSTYAAATRAEKLEVCENISKLAETVMEKRQEGNSMAKMMQVGKGNPLVEISQTMVISAFEEPGYNSPEYQNRAIRQFRDKWYLGCVKEMLKE